MNTVLDNWLDELLDHSNKSSSTNTLIEIDAAKPSTSTTSPKTTLEPRLAHHLPENIHTPSPWAKLQVQAQQAPAVVTVSESVSRWLRLRCGQQTYAVELLKVQEVVLPLPLLALRGSEPAMLGIMNLRGQVVPVIDLSLYLGGQSTQTNSHTRIVVLEENGQTLGLYTDAVDDVAYLKASDIEAPNHIGLRRNAHTLFCGMARINEQPTILLDAGQLLHAEAAF